MAFQILPAHRCRHCIASSAPGARVPRPPEPVAFPRYHCTRRGYPIRYRRRSFRLCQRRPLEQKTPRSVCQDHTFRAASPAPIATGGLRPALFAVHSAPVSRHEGLRWGIRDARAVCLKTINSPFPHENVGNCWLSGVIIGVLLTKVR